MNPLVVEKDTELKKSTEKRSEKSNDKQSNDKHNSPVKLKIDEIVAESLCYTTPAWPLQNTVAVNPFWNHRDQPFSKVMSESRKVYGATPYMSVAYYRKQLESGTLDAKVLRSLLGNVEIEDFLKDVELSEKSFQKVQLLSDNQKWVLLDLGRYCAAYMDSKQAIAIHPFSGLPFFEYWLASLEYDPNINSSHHEDVLSQFFADILGLKSKTLDESIVSLLENMEFQDSAEIKLYLSALVGGLPGWFSQFSYVEWQKSLGYQVDSKAERKALLLVRLCYEYLLYLQVQKDSTSALQKWKASIAKSVRSNFSNQSELFQRAMELSYQLEVSKKINPLVTAEETPLAQMVFCIDVRSEPLRRNIEKLNPKIKTMGFAGFFGLAADVLADNEPVASHRLPVLLSPGVVAKEVHSKVSNKKIGPSAGAFFKSLRKHSMSSFVYVEYFGASYGFKFLNQLYQGMKASSKRGKLRIPERFLSVPLDSKFELYSASNQCLTLGERVDRAQGILKHMGLTRDFAKIVMIVGHGSDTQNNAFGSSLDCGACGGHAGDLNARILSALLNDREVREQLKGRNIVIPEETTFYPAVHETVRDQIYLLDEKGDENTTIADLTQVFHQASVATQKERFQSKSQKVDPNAERRAGNWSEVRAEWGLAGNACFIVAKRERTKGNSFDGRSFLHDYDWRADEQSGFATLELIMTAPMVVTNWINMQYYASTVSPHCFGAGDKTLHNLVNETGVYEGNGGDLKVGLPLQSLHDGEKWIHDPLRLSVFIEAPLSAIDAIIQKHKVVKDLVKNEWLYLFQIDSNGKVERVS